MGRLRLGHDGLEVMAGLLGLGQALVQLVILAFEQPGPSLRRAHAGRELRQRAAVTLEGVLQRCQLPLGHSDGLLGPAELGPVPPRGQVGSQLGADGGLGLVDDLPLRSEGGHVGIGGLELGGQTGALRLQGRDHVGVGGGVERLGQ